MPNDKQAELAGVVIEPARYRELAQPFASAAVLDEVVEAFFRDLGELRLKHRLPDLYVILQASAQTPDGEEGQYTSALHYGGATLAENMTAWAFGREQAQRQERTARILAATSALRKSRRAP